jgi:hypothetical protein
VRKVTDPLNNLLSRGFRTESGCLVLPGRATYSTVKVFGRTVKAHRFVYESAFGHTDEYVLHHCDNPPCFELSHLYAGTQSRNMLDMYERGRREPTDFSFVDRRGAMNPNWKGGISLDASAYAAARRANKTKVETV